MRVFLCSMGSVLCVSTQHCLRPQFLLHTTSISIHSVLLFFLFLLFTGRQIVVSFQFVQPYNTFFGIQ